MFYNQFIKKSNQTKELEVHNNTVKMYAID